MADFGGFAVKTPEEVLAQMAAQQQQISQLPTAQRRVANAQFQMANMFGNPELDKAREIESRFKSLGASEIPADGLSSERDRLSSMFEAVKDIDPLVASQIATRLTEVDVTIAEQSRLDASESRAEQRATDQHAESQYRQEAMGHVQSLDSFAYLETYNPETGTLLGTKAYDMDSPGERAKFDRDSQEPNTVRRKREEVDFENLIVNAGGKVVPGYAVDKDRRAVVASTRGLNLADRLVTILKSDPGANTFTNEVLRKVNEMANEAQRATNIVSGDSPPPQGGKWISRSEAEGIIDRTLSGIEGFSGIYARNRGTFTALTLNMAYSLARSLDPGGRLSDHDVLYATKMIGASNGNPKTLIRILAEQMAPNYRINRSLGAGHLGQQGEFMKSYLADQEAAYESFYENVRTYPGIPKEEIAQIFFPGKLRLTDDPPPGPDDSDDSDSDLVDGAGVLSKHGITFK